LAAACLVSACSQFTTNDAERSLLRAAADQQADAYIECVRRESRSYSGSNSDAAFIYTAVADRCSADIDLYRESATEYYLSKVIMTEAPVEAEVEDLERRARSVIAEQMINAAPAPASAAVAPAAAAAAVPAAIATRPASSPAGNWQGDQRVYLDCMVEQAKRYASLQESAETIAEVAENNCRAYLGGAGAQSLAAEGRARVLSTVFDARVGQ